VDTLEVRLENAWEAWEAARAARSHAEDTGYGRTHEFAGKETWHWMLKR